MGQVDTLMQEWLRHRQVLEKLLLLIKDEDMSFKPWEGAMTLSQLALHVGYWSNGFVTLVKTGDAGFPVLMEAQPDITNYETMDEIRQGIHDWTEETIRKYAELTDEDLEVENDSKQPNFRGPRKLFLHLMRDHEVHHKGQLFVYARMVGVKELPFFY